MHLWALRGNVLAPHHHGDSVMASRPKQRMWEAKIKELGGLTYLLERVAAGEPIRLIAQDVGCSRQWLNTWLRHPKRREPYGAARRESADAHAELATEALENAPINRDAIALAREMANHRRWLASKYDRETYGDDAKVQINQQFNTGKMFIEALTYKPPVGQMPIASPLGVKQLDSRARVRQIGPGEATVEPEDSPKEGGQG